MCLSVKRYEEVCTGIFFSFESFVTRYKLQKTSLKLIYVSISDFHLEMPFIESTSKSSSGLSLFYISFDKLVELRIVLIKWLLYSAFVMLVTFLLLIMDIKLRYFKKLGLKLN
jgi:hypothetical protein